MGPAAPRSVFVHRNPPNRSGINKPWWWFFDRNYPELNNSLLSLSWRCSGALDADAATLALHNPVSDALRLPTKELFQLYNNSRFGLVRQPPSYPSSMKVKQTEHRRVRNRTTLEQGWRNGHSKKIYATLRRWKRKYKFCKVDPNFIVLSSVVRLARHTTSS